MGAPSPPPPPPPPPTPPPAAKPPAAYVEGKDPNKKMKRQQYARASLRIPKYGSGAGSNVGG